MTTTAPLNRRTLLSTAVIAAPATVLVNGSAVFATGQHPDAELLILGRERAELIEKIDGGGWPDDEVELLCDRLGSVEQEIMGLIPATPAGLAVQFTTV